MMPMKHILVLAYQCSPSKGSEYSVAWNYVINMSKYHKLVVIYGASGDHMGECSEMEDYSLNNQNPNIEFICIKPNFLSSTLNWCNRHGFLKYSFYFAYNVWQRQVYSFVKKMLKEKNIDLIHFLNPIGFREPGYLWKLNKPYIWGPVGGVANYPTRLFSPIKIKEKLKNWCRSLINDYQFKRNRRLKQALSNCDVLLTASTEVQKQFYDLLGKGSIYLPENGISKEVILNEEKFGNIEKLELTVIGRIDAGKNIGLLLDCLKMLPCKNKVHLNIVGNGNQKESLQIFSEKNDLSDLITWHGQKTSEEVFELLDRSHLHVITSLKESNPTVIWEAMSKGVPTLSLDHCGMHDVICSECGFKIEISSYDQVVADIVGVLNRCIDHPEILKEKALGTISCAKKYLWESREELFLKCYDQAIAEHNK